MEPCYPTLSFDLQRDCFVVWLRWVALEDLASADHPAESRQGIRVELQINRNPVLGPTIVFRRDLATPVYLRANGARTREVLRMAMASERKIVDLGLIIHGSIANAPFAALYQVRDYAGEAIDTAAIPATPLLQLQPSSAAEPWQIAAQASLRVRLDLQQAGRPAPDLQQAGSLHLKVIK